MREEELKKEDTTIASVLSDYIFSHSSWLSFFEAEWSAPCCWGLNLISRVLLPSSPWAGHTGWCYASSLSSLLLTLCCCHRLEGSFFFHYVFSSLACSVISRVFAQFRAEGRQSILTTESEGGLCFQVIVEFLLHGSRWPACPLCPSAARNPGDSVF